MSGKYHGMKNTPEYNSWRGMLARCRDPKNKAYKWYGAKGVSVCDRWKESFVDFYEDMGKKPSPKHSIDRIDPDGSYEPENCRWATQTEQMINQKLKVTNKSGFKGVSWRPDHKKWAAQICRNRNIKHLGFYDTPEKASKVYQKAVTEYQNANQLLSTS